MIYRGRGRSLLWLAFACALGIHIAAIAVAENQSRIQEMPVDGISSEVVGFDPAEPSPAQTEETLPNEVTPPPTTDEAFPEERLTPAPIRPRKRLTTPISSRTVGTGAGIAANFGSVKALVLFGPRPSYPYEARRGHITGSGIAVITLNSAGGAIDVQMRQSTGSSILDRVTIETLRRWRFKPNATSRVEVPITYTLSGVSY